MKQDRDVLVTQMIIAIEDITKKSMFDEVIKKAENKMEGLGGYFKSARIKQIISGSAIFVSMSVSDLYNIANFLNKNKLINVDLSEYFLDDEISVAVENKIDDEDEYKNRITFNRVLSNKEQSEFITMLPYSELAKMFKSGVFNYNFVTQRAAKVVKYRGAEVNVADVNMKSVRNIADLVKAGRFGMNAITLNMRVGINERFDYNSENMILDILRQTTLDDRSILKNTEIDLIDGYHRTEGITLAYEENPNIQGEITVIIKHLTEKGARAFIAQEAMGNINNQEIMRMYNPLGNVAKTIKYINSSCEGDAFLSNRISVTKNEYTYIYDSIFSKNIDKACSKVIDDADDIELREFADYICEFYNVAYGYICRKFKVKTIDELKGTLARDMMFMSGFLYPATKLYRKYGTKIDMDKIKDIVEKIDLNSEIEDSQYTYEDGDKKSFNRYVKAWETV